jgi:ubiquinone/menaquinone biosynthesis methyltransferase
MSPRFALKGREHLADPERKRRFNRLHFEEAAPRYDFATKAMSLGLDASWKRALVDALPDLAAPMCVDVACGTGDVTLLLAARYPRGTVLGVDLVPRMLAVARRRNRFPNVRFHAGDLCTLPIADGVADVVTGSYALRNAPELRVALSEIRRVLKPGGVAGFLEFCRPERSSLQAAQYHLLRCWCGFWGALLHGTPEIHGYVAESLNRFPDRPRLGEMVREAGFAVERLRRFFPGVTELLVLGDAGVYPRGTPRQYNGTSGEGGRLATERLLDGYKEVSTWKWR